MVIVLFLLFSWFSIHVVAGLPRKLPLAVNFLLVLAIEVVLTNKLTIMGFSLGLFRIHTSSIPHFISLILHNDFTIPFILLAFTNLFLTTTSTAARWAITLYTFLLQLFLGALLQWTGVLTHVSWNMAMESLMIVCIMAYTLLLGSLFRRMAAREGWVR